MTDKKTALFDRVKELGGKIVSFAGYEMPVQFNSIKLEHKAVRECAGIFDVSHMTEFYFDGAGAVDSVNRLLTNDVSPMKVGDVMYSLMCIETGGVVDDLIVYKTKSDQILLVMNAARHKEDKAHIEKNLTGDVTFTDKSSATSQIALQGPKAEEILKLIGGSSFASLSTMKFTTGELLGVDVLISRTGYTGEDGFEIYCDNDAVLKIYDALIEKGTPLGLLPIGLGARDTLRLEAKLPLYGNELDEQTTPLEARLKWAVSFKKGDFIGKSALEKQLDAGVSKKLVGFEMIDKGIGRHGYNVVDLGNNNEIIGVVTSGSVALSLEKNIGLAYVPSKGYKSGVEIGIDIRGKIKKAKIVKTPFYRRKS